MMKPFNLFYTFFLLLFIPGVIVAEIPQEISHGHEYESKSPLKVGEIGPDGKLVIDSWGNHYRTLDGYYGMMIWYNKYETNSKPKFQLFLQRDKKFEETEDLKLFLSFISKVPKSSRLYYYDRCTAGTHYGLDPKIMAIIRKKLEEQKITVLGPGEGGFVICTCEKVP